MVIRVLLADDQAMVRGALGALLGLEPDIEVVAQVATGAEVLDAARDSAADVCLLDVQMPGTDGIEATAALRSALPEVRVLIVATFNRPGYLRRAMDAGASGFMVKDTPAEQLAEAVRRVHRGLNVIDPALAAASLLAGANPLTPREQQALTLAAAGRPVSAVAADLHLSTGTVRNLLSSAIAKTNTANRVQAAQVASEQGWI